MWVPRCAQQVHVGQWEDLSRVPLRLGEHAYVGVGGVSLLD